MRPRPSVLVAALAIALLPAPLRGGETVTRVPTSGPSAEVSVTTDRWGIPHLEARSLDDLYFAWGWVDARDRLWQMVHTRAAAEGRTHRWLGNAQLQADGGAQLFRLRERADAIWQRDRRDPLVRSSLERYAAGVNAVLADCRAGRRAWPAELARLNERPRDWAPQDVVLVLLGLGVTLDLDFPELAEARSVREHGAAWVTERRRYEDRWLYDTVPDTAAVRMWPARAEGSVPSGRTSLAPGPSPAAAREADRWLAAYPTRATDGSDRASNQFVVGARRAARGAPLLANDPHLALTSPGAFHVVHVHVPGQVDAIGAAVPGLPLIASGRNRRAAWGVTAVSADVIDVYADTLSQDRKRVRTHAGDGTSGWADVRTEPYALTYKVLGVLPVPVPTFMNARRYTPHGPVLVWDTKQGIAFSARWSALEDDRITLTGLLGLERSRDAAELERRAATLVTPCLNLVAADVDGGAIYRANGLLPIRPVRPAPGPLPSDGLHEWQGFVPTADMPHWNVPAGSFAVNANNRPVGDAWPWDLPRYDWAHDRARRIAQRLAGDASLTLADVMSVQNDVVSLAADRHVRNLLACADSLASVLPARSRAALDTLRHWDLVVRRDRVAPTLYRAWFAALQRRLGTEGLPGLTLAALMDRAPETLAGVPTKGEPETPAVAAAASLATALDTLAAKLGPDLATWTYGRAHRARFRHVLSSLDGRARWEQATVPMDGDNATPSVGPSRLPWSTEVAFGPVYRHVADLADSTMSWGVVPPFNSAASASHGDRDLRDRWATHGYVPFLLERARIEREAAERLVLTR